MEKDDRILDVVREADREPVAAEQQALSDRPAA
jgi:hypothetical protein